jgi:nucleotide-binding universal stress UspA family protein
VLPASYELPLDTSEIIESVTSEADRKLNELARRAQAGKVRVVSMIRVGDVDREIREIVEERKVDLIVMGTHGRRGVQKFLLGSETEKLIRTTPVPIVTISGKAGGKASPPRIRRILVTTDFSEGTADAIRHAFSIGQECQAEVTLLHVLNDVDANISGRYRNQLIKSIRLELESLIPEDARDWCDIQVRVETGVPVRRIPRILKTEKFDLLVMNVHGKGMFERVLLGRTAEGVVRSAEIPVLLVPSMTKAKRRKRQRAAVA